MEPALTSLLTFGDATNMYWQRNLLDVGVFAGCAPSETCQQMRMQGLV